MGSWSLVSPLPFYADTLGAIGDGLDMGHGLGLQATPAWFHRSLDGLDEDERLTCLRSRFVLMCQYEADGLGAVDPWGGVAKHSPHARARDLISTANLAFWITRPSELRTAAMFHYERPDIDVGPTLYTRQTAPRINEQDQAVSLSQHDLASARHLFGALVSVSRDNAVWIALRMLHKAIHDPGWEARLVFMWIALEGLFGPAGGGELRYRLGLRLAAFLGTDLASRTDIFRQSRSSYDLRSKVVHGAILDPGPDAQTIAQETESLVRRAVSAVLAHADVTSRFTGKDRDAYLDGLVLGAPDAKP